MFFLGTLLFSAVLVVVAIHATRRLWLPLWFYEWSGREFRRGVEMYAAKARRKAEFYAKAQLIQTMQAEFFEDCARRKRERESRSAAP